MYVDGRWQIDPLRTLVHLRARGFGRAAHCKVDVRSGAIDLVDGGNRGILTAEVDLTTFRSGNDRRDRHVQSADFLDVRRYPVATFTAAWQGGPPTTLQGELRVRETSAPVTMSVTITSGASGEVTFRATTELSRRACGITRAPVVLADRVGVVVEGTAHLAGAAEPDAVYGDESRRRPDLSARDRAIARRAADKSRKGGGRGGS